MLKEEIKVRAGEQLEREDYLLLYKSKAQIVNILIDVEEENKKLKQQLEQRDNIINKARECIKENSLEVNTKEYGNIIVVNSDNLLEILDNKGDIK